MIKSKQDGFTLIELVVVIVILGILAAFAVPRFMGLEGNARAASLKNLGGTLLSAATMARAKCQAQECQTGAGGGTVTIDGVGVTMVNGYPNRAGITQLLDPNTMSGFIVTNQGGNRRRFLKAGGGANCWVEYTQSAALNVPPLLVYGVAAPPVTPAPTALQLRAWNEALANACS